MKFIVSSPRTVCSDWPTSLSELKFAIQVVILNGENMANIVSSRTTPWLVCDVVHIRGVECHSPFYFILFYRQRKMLGRLLGLMFSELLTNLLLLP